MQPAKQTIGAFTYTCMPLTAVPGRRAFVRLAKVLGPALGAAAMAAEGDEGGMVAAFAGLVQHLSEDDVDYFCDLFGASCTVRIGKEDPLVKDIFETHFMGRYLDMFKWLAFCVMTNFGDFFAGLRAKAAAQTAETTPTPSA